MAINPNPITAGAQAGSMITQTVSNIIDQGQRIKFEQSLALLSNQQLNTLNEKLLKANTQIERLQILSDSVVEYASANAKAKQTKQTVMYVIVGVIAIGVLGGAIFLSFKNKL